MIQIGPALKEARSKKSVSYDDVHLKTKIHPRILQLLEEEKFDKIPSPLFVKSFLKTYAEYLELSPEELVGAYEKRNGGREVEQTMYIPSTIERQNAAAAINRQYIVIPIACAIAGILLYMGYDMLRHMKPWKVNNRATVAIKKNIGKPAVIPAPKPLEKEKKQGEWLRSVEQGNFPKLSKRTRLDLTIRAIDDVWMRVTCDGKVLYESILKKGNIETWVAENKIEIWSGNSSNMALTLNKSSLGSPGKGVVKKMVISHDGVRNVAA